MSVQHVVSTLPCNLCGGDDVTVVSRRSRSGKPLRSVACTRCGLVWSDPRPYEAERFYTEDYRLAYKQTFTPRPKHVLRAGRVALDRLGKIRSLLDRHCRILDVGSGGGEFAYLLQSLGHEVVGVEPNRGYAAYSAEQYGLRVERGFIGQVALPDEGFDLITVWHVLEHTEDPGAVLAQLRRALRPGGTLVVEVPNVEATCQSPRSSFHEAHVYTFGRPTLGALGARHGLLPVETRLSGDGGNLTALFRKAPAADALGPERDGLAGNHARVTATIAAHTPVSHALSMHPWRRAAGRLARAAQEQWALRSGLTGKALLDRQYGIAPRQPRAASTVRPGWGWLLGAYAAAVAAEELLLDRALPMSQLSAGEAFAVYAGLQLAVVGALMALAGRRPATLKDALKIGGWAAPLFVVPALC